MSAPLPSDEHMRRAYAELQKPGWPPLEAMREAHLHFVAVQGLARNLATTPALFGKPVHQACPAPQPAASLASALKHPPTFDGRSAGAGEYVHHQGDE